MQECTHDVAGLWPATSWVQYTTSCNTQSSAPEDGRDQRPKYVELIGIINQPLLLHLVGVYIIYINDARSNKYQVNPNITYKFVSYRTLNTLTHAIPRTSRSMLFMEMGLSAVNCNSRRSHAHTHTRTRTRAICQGKFLTATAGGTHNNHCTLKWQCAV